MMFTGVIFDFNGTLFWDTDLHNRAWDEFLSKYNLNISDAEKFEKMHGKNNKDLLDTFFEGKLTKEKNDQLSLEKELIYQQLCLKTDMHLAPSAESFLDFLKEQNIPFTIATASCKENVVFYFEHLNLGKWFEFEKVVYNNGKIKGKPDPEIYQIAMKMIDRQAKEVIVFEDAIAGLQAAKNANAGKIIVVDSYNDNYSAWSDCQKIKNYDEVDRSLFQ